MSVDRRLRWWTELPLIAAVYVLYSAGRLVARGDEETAVEHGLELLRLERLVSLDFETPLNRLFTDVTWIGLPAAFAYATLHYAVTPAVLIWLFRRSSHYRLARGWLMTSTLIGLIGFTLLPTCPPRLLDAGHGFVDTMAQYSDYGWWGVEASAPEGLGGLTNQFAAMPSLHVGWALWCGVAVWRWGPRLPWLRVLAVAHPVSTTLIVMGTANHYFLDAVAGFAVMGVGLLLTPRLLRTVDRLRANRRAARRAESPSAVGAPPEQGDGAVPTPRDAPEAVGKGRKGALEETGQGALEETAEDPPERRSVAAVPTGTHGVSGGCQTSPGTAISPEAPADDHIPQPRTGQPAAAGRRAAALAEGSASSGDESVNEQDSTAATPG